MLDKFAPKETVHLGDTIMAALLSFFLLTNAARMFAGLTRGQQIPARLYFAQIGLLIVQGVTQMQWKNCNESDGRRNWVRHLFLVSGYAMIFTLVVLFLPWFQIEDSSFHWTSVLGYYSTAALLITTAWMVADRISKRTEMHRSSHLSDWLFPVLLFLTAVTGILVNIFRLMNQPMPTYVTYVVHMAVAVPMLIVEVPFGKWSHLLYRPLGIFVATVKRKALESAGEQPVLAGTALAGKG
jgi:nitrate reductase gamma subunit